MHADPLPISDQPGSLLRAHDGRQGARRQVAAEIKGRWAADKTKRIDKLQRMYDDLEDQLADEAPQPDKVIA
jgi:hypothetical protein